MFWLGDGVRILGVVAALSLAAQVRIPIPGSPVPMTLQSWVVLLIGLTCSVRVAFLGTVAYVLAGSAGLPILANAAGLFGPTGGYLAGFAVAAPLVAACRGPRNARLARGLASSLLGVSVILAFGVAWTWLGLGLNGRAAFAAGVFPFLAKAVIEALLAVSAVRVVRFGGRDGESVS